MAHGHVHRAVGGLLAVSSELYTRQLDATLKSNPVQPRLPRTVQEFMPARRHVANSALAHSSGAHVVHAVRREEDIAEAKRAQKGDGHPLQHQHKKQGEHDWPASHTRRIGPHSIVHSDRHRYFENCVAEHDHVAVPRVSSMLLKRVKDLLKIPPPALDHQTPGGDPG